MDEFSIFQWLITVALILFLLFLAGMRRRRPPTQPLPVTSPMETSRPPKTSEKPWQALQKIIGRAASK